MNYFQPEINPVEEQYFNNLDEFTRQQQFGQPFGGQPYGGQPYGGQPYGGYPPRPQRCRWVRECRWVRRCRPGYGYGGYGGYGDYDNY